VSLGVEERAVARSSILSDELVRQLVAVGQVDILVGVPTFNNAATVERVVTTLHTGLAKHFPRERTVLLNADGGSDDGTVERVLGAPLADEELRGSTMLRTTHRVSAHALGLPGRGSGVRTVFAAADLLQAGAVMIVDPAVTTMTSDWVAELARPAWKGEAELVLPIHPRGRFEGPLVTQLVRPLVSTAYGRRLRSSVVGGFGCSNRFATRMLRHELWERDWIRPAVDTRMLTTALADDIDIVHAYLGPCRFAEAGTPPPLNEVFGHVVGATFASLEEDAGAWLGRSEPRELPAVGAPRPWVGDEPGFDPAPMVERFRAGVRDLEPLLRDILLPDTHAALQVVSSRRNGMPEISDTLWASTVYEFAAAAHRGVMNREHLVQALVSLYLGRTASFFAEIARWNETAMAERLTALEREFETLRPYLVERWNAERGR